MASTEIKVTINRPGQSSELEVVVVERDTRKYDSLYSAVKRIGRERFWNGSLVAFGGLAAVAGVGITAGEVISWATTGNVDWNRVSFGVVSLGNATAILVRSAHDFTKASKIAERLRQL